MKETTQEKFKIFGHGRDGWWEIDCGWCVSLEEFFQYAALRQGVHLLRYGYIPTITIVQL